MTNTQTGWSEGLPDTEGDYFSRVDEYDGCPTPIRIENNGAIYEFGQGGNLRREYAAEDYEYLGPFTAKDFEQLLRLRQIAEKALKAMSYPRHKDTATLMERIADEIDSKAAEGWTSFTTPHLRRAANDIREAANGLRSVLPEK